MIPCFYHKELSALETGFSLSEETSKHCVQVLRMQTGEQLHLTNGNGLKALVEISSAHKKNTLVTVRRMTEEKPVFQKNSIAISLLKNTARLEWFLEKATELGIYEIIPLLCRRTEKQQFKKARLESICISAMLQSQQSFMPVLREPVFFGTYVKNTDTGKKFIAHCMDTDKLQFQNQIVPNESQLILIGPEGDFTKEEIELSFENGFIPVSLGNTRLRTETAGIAAAVLMQLAEPVKLNK
jgi:16S rRNA (uracil1498-N3)-methyltransferase